MATASVATIGQPITGTGGRTVNALLAVCIAVAAVVVAWQVRQREQEPAIFAAATYFALGGVAAIAQTMGVTRRL